jgi:hypothetical protein
MRCRLVRGIVVALSLLSMPALVGCEARSLRVQLPGFAGGTIDGIWLWKQISGQWTRVCRIDFEDYRITQSGEQISYVQNCINGVAARALVFPTPVERVPGSTTTVEIELVYLRYEAPGSYRATAFNEAGESALSSTSLPL